MPSTINTRADTENSLARWKPKKVLGHAPVRRMPHSSTRQGLSIVPVAQEASVPDAFQPERDTPARHGRCIYSNVAVKDVCMQDQLTCRVAHLQQGKGCFV